MPLYLFTTEVFCQASCWSNARRYEAISCRQIQDFKQYGVEFLFILSLIKLRRLCSRTGVHSGISSTVWWTSKLLEGPPTLQASSPPSLRNLSHVNTYLNCINTTTEPHTTFSVKLEEIVFNSVNLSFDIDMESETINLDTGIPYLNAMKVQMN